MAKENAELSPAKKINIKKIYKKNTTAPGQNKLVRLPASPSPNNT
jgi:hypothetical protein